MTTDHITITDLRARTLIGLHEWERTTRQDIYLTLTLFVDLDRISATDNIRDGLNYADIIHRALTHVEQAERYTIERLAAEVAGICTSPDQVHAARVRLDKPDASRFAEKVSVTLERTAEQLTTDVLVSLGSNHNPADKLPAAIHALRTLGQIVTTSRAYQSRPEGDDHAPADYVNAAVHLRSCLPPAELRRRMKQIESDLGRNRDDPTNPGVPIDLDLCIAGPHVINASDVVVPNSDVLHYEHVALPLAELMPALHYPGTNDTLRDIARHLEGTGRLTQRDDISL